jgi:hypothetical protein
MRWREALSVGFVLLGVRCAVYENALDGPAARAPVADAGAGGKSAAGNGAVAGGSSQPGGGGRPSDGVGGELGDGGSSVLGVSGANNAGEQSAGGVDGAGGESTAGGGGTGGSAAGTGGSAAGTGGSAAGTAGTGGSAPDTNLSRAKPATSDSEQTSAAHDAADGNDGDLGSRWCAADSQVNHYWEVDLGKSFSLGSLHILWEKSVAYLFKVETSVDHTSWSIVVDKTASSAATADQQHALPAGTKGRYVRITVTGGLNASTWASFFELEVFGH